MTILFFSRLFYPHIGGVEKHVLEVGRRLVKKGHKVIVVTEMTPSAHSSNYQSDSESDKVTGIFQGIQIYRIYAGKNDWFKKLRLWKGLFNNIGLIRKADIVHCHDVFFWYLPFRFLYPRKPVYTTFHGYEGYPLRKKAILMRKISEYLSFGNICIGDFIKKWYKTKPTFVSYGGVSVDKIRNVRLKIKNKRSAVFVGRLDEQTGILTYLKAYDLIKKKVPDFDLTVIGDGKYSNNIGNGIKYIKARNNAEDFFYSCRFAFVSRYLSIIEAMAAKRLVFAAYDNPIKEDYLKMSPFAKFIIIEKDPDEIAEKVTYYLKYSEEEKNLTENAYKWVEEQSWEKVIEIYLDLWRNIRK